MFKWWTNYKNVIMKKAILLLLFIVFTIQTNAQDYVPLAIEGAQWVIYKEHTDPDGLPPFEFYPPFNDQYYGYKIEGNITINGIDYKKVYRRSFTPVNPDTNNFITTPLFIDDEYLFGAIRDDVPNRKVYGIKFCNADYYHYPDWCNCDEEILMYDFNMNINDYYPNSCLFEFAYGNDGDYYIGEIIYQYIEEETRQIQRIYDSIGDTYLLRMFEGMGSNAGLFEGLCYFECNPKTFLALYCVGTDEECLQDYLLANNNHFIDIITTIYPNPTNDIINIDLIDKLDAKIQIFNMYGKKVFNKQFVQDFIAIDISNYTNGIYILKINNQTIKLIKQ